jgi:2-hydroxychromene-2-carboxylate isomerase
LAWAKAHGSQEDVDSYVRDILHRFWRLHEDVDSIVSVESVLEHAGLGTEGFAALAGGAGLAHLEQASVDAQNLGLSVSPTYFIGAEPFQGRQHLPLLAARMRSRS